MKHLLCILLIALPCYGLGDFVQSCKDSNKDQVVYGSATGNAVGVSATAADKVEQIFRANCVGCHGGGTGLGPIKNILSAKSLREIPGMIDTLDAANSRLYKSIANGRMPLGQDKLADTDIATVKTWIEEGAPDFGTGTDPIEVGEPFLQFPDEVQCIAADLVSNVKPSEAYYTRYVSLIPLWNNKNGLEMDALRQALEFGLNSVSRKNKRAKPVYIDKYHTVARFDLRDYALDFNDWEKRIIVRYPYAFEPFDNTLTFTEERVIQKISGSARAWVRADWLLDEISQAPIYNELLRLPNTTQELEKDYLHLDIVGQFIDGDVVRAGIRNSGVANYNRIVDLFQLEHGSGASVLQGEGVLYTKTYDFLNDQHAKNIFNAPFGPGEIFGKTLYRWLDSFRVFEHDASEIIFTLPNGLNGYFLANGKGVFQRAAPTKIAVDPLNHRPYIGEQPFEIVNGVSCMGCHSAGLNPYDENLKAHVQASAGFSNQEVKALEFLYADQAVHNSKVKAFNTGFQATVLAMGMPKTSLTRRGSPVWTAVREYVSDSSIVKLGAELYLPESEVKRAIFHEPDLARALGLATDGSGQVSRDNVEKKFAEIVSRFYVGKQVLFKKADIVVEPHKACQYTFKNSSDYSQRISSITQGKDKILGETYVNKGASLRVEHSGDAVLQGCFFFKDGHCRHFKLALDACQSYRFDKSQDGYVYLYEE